MPLQVQIGSNRNNNYAYPGQDKVIIGGEEAQTINQVVGAPVRAAKSIGDNIWNLGKSFGRGIDNIFRENNGIQQKPLLISPQYQNGSYQNNQFNVPNPGMLDLNRYHQQQNQNINPQPPKNNDDFMYKG